MKIYGAGLAGLLAGHMFRRFEPEIHEIQPELPNNHEAVLRFRSEAVSIATAIPFKKVRVTKQVAYEHQIINRPSIQIANTYSLKVTGQVLNRSILNLDPVDRWIAPLNFIDQLSNGLNIKYKSALTLGRLEKEGIKISTIPMRTLGYLTGHKWIDRTWNYKPVWNVVVDIEEPIIDVYQTTYFPSPNAPCYRATLTGPRLIVEYMQAPENYTDDVEKALSAFGIQESSITEYRVHKMEYGKLLPIDDIDRKNTIRMATEKFQCYSLGRFATWRQILLDDVVNDIKVIERLIESDPYTRALAEISK